MYKNKAFLAYEKEQRRRSRRGALEEFEGTVIGTTGSRLFFRPDIESDQDWYIPEEDTLGAMHQDRVSVVRLRDTGRGPCCSVMKILRRAHADLTCVIKGGRAVPDDKHIHHRITLERGEIFTVDGDRVVVHITQFPDGWDEPRGVVTELLGRRGTPEADVMAVVRRYGIRDRFPDEVMAEAARLKDHVSSEEIGGRLDLRKLTAFTIDGAHSKDFDDAVSIEPLEHGAVRLGVHIADVNAYVPAGSPIDEEARLRGTSVYFADRVIPMLPESLSNGICSLNEGVDRLTLSCIMDVASDGRVTDHRIAESVICSSHRLVYGDINLLLAGDKELNAKYADILPQLHALEKLFYKLNDRRMERGAIDFDVPESEFFFDGEGHAVGLKRAERGISERIIEECMLLANQTVARHLKEKALPALYRVHEVPEASKAEELSRFLKTLGYRNGIGSIADPHCVQDVLDRAKGTPEEGVVSRLLLRSMQRARYCPEPLGHYGLALGDYCHFTSPIRRYPDLVVHRALKLSMQGDAGNTGLSLLRKEVGELGTSTSACERAAMEAERAVDDVKRCEYMHGHLGEVYEGIISGIVSGGFFVELENTAEGFVRLETLHGDRWRTDAKNYRVKAERSGKVMRLGDKVSVQVVRADMESGEIDLLIHRGYNKEGPEHGERRAKRVAVTVERRVKKNGRTEYVKSGKKGGSPSHGGHKKRR